MNLSKAQRQALQKEGMTSVKLVEENIVNGGVNLLLAGKSQYGDRLWGTWNDGESAGDIRWQYEKANA